MKTWYNPGAFVTPAPYTFGNVARNTMRGPDDRDFDFALLKNFRITETKRVQFRSEFFNLLNHTNFGVPSINTLSAAGAILPERAFRFAYEGGADFICAGMFDFQLPQNVAWAKQILAGTLARTRPWLA